MKPRLLLPALALTASAVTGCTASGTTTPATSTPSPTISLSANPDTWVGCEEPTITSGSDSRVTVLVKENELHEKQRGVKYGKGVPVWLQNAVGLCMQALDIDHSAQMKALVGIPATEGTGAEGYAIREDQKYSCLSGPVRWLAGKTKGTPPTNKPFVLASKGKTGFSFEDLNLRYTERLALAESLASRMEKGGVDVFLIPIDGKETRRVKDYGEGFKITLTADRDLGEKIRISMRKDPLYSPHAYEKTPKTSREAYSMTDWC